MVTDCKNKTFDITIIALTFFMVLLCLIPMLNVASVSLSSNTAILSRKVFLWPVELTFHSYSAVLSDPNMVYSLFFTIFLTIIFTTFSMLMTIQAAYPLTKKHLKGRNAILMFIIITMYFSGGMIPDYILIKDLGFLNKIWALLLPGMLSAFNMIILKTFFENLPESLEESAYLDGASHPVILFRIVLPLSKPVLATLSLFYAVGRWNGFQDALLYVSDSRLYPIQMKLYQIIFNNMTLDVVQAEGSASNILQPESLKAATVMFATIPILLAYPWLQRYFISGIMIGAIKG